MTISFDNFAPLLFVVGSTCVRGRFVIKAPKTHRSRIVLIRGRAITRDVSKDAAKDLDRIDCEVVKGDADGPASWQTLKGQGMRS
jgi:hypothetical protein